MSPFDEKRKFPRLGSRFPLRYRNLKNPVEDFKGTISKNISEGGVKFKSEKFISLACRLVVELNLPTVEKPIRAISKIAWIKKISAADDYEIGNQFLEISREDRELIRNFIYDKLDNPQP